jgi:hypothetical protein
VKKIIALITIAFLSGMLNGCGNIALDSSNVGDSKWAEISEDSNMIIHFSYSRKVGTGPGESYRIASNDLGRLVIDKFSDIRRWGKYPERDISIPLSEAKYEELERLIENYNLVSWDGFKNGGNRQRIIDGDEFFLKIEWDDGATIEAWGNVEWPANFETVDLAIIEYFYSFLED